MMDFSTPFFILKPVDTQRGNYKIFYAVKDRGNNLEGLLIAASAAQVAGTDAGYAMTQGYTMLTAVANELVNERFLLDVDAATDISVAQASVLQLAPISEGAWMKQGWRPLARPSGVSRRGGLNSPPNAERADDFVSRRQAKSRWARHRGSSHRGGIVPRRFRCRTDCGVC
jgi:hypothetical protein